MGAQGSQPQSSWNQKKLPMNVVMYHSLMMKISLIGVMILVGGLRRAVGRARQCLIIFKTTSMHFTTLKASDV